MAVKQFKCRTWYFTFRNSSKYWNKYCKIFNTYNAARDEANKRFPNEWMFMYNEHNLPDISHLTELKIKGI